MDAVPTERDRVAVRASSAVVLVLFIALAAVALTSWPTADDYCNRVMVAEKGVGGAIQWLYFTWSGRLASGAPLYLTFSFVDLPALRWVSLALAGMLTLAAWQIASFLALEDRAARWPLFAFILASLALGLYPLLGQAVFWATGGIVYMLPLVLTLLWLVPVRRLLHGRSLRGGAAYGFALGVAVGDSIELVWPILAAYLALVVPREWRSLPEKDRLSLQWRMAGVAAGALLLVAAPGNYVRATASPGSFEFEPVYLASSYVFMLYDIAANAWPMVAIIVALAGALLLASHRLPDVEPARGSPSPLREASALAIGALLSIVPVLAVPPQYAPRNGLFMLVFALVAALVPLVAWARRSAWRGPALRVLAGLAAAGALVASVELGADARLAAAIRERQLARDSALRQLPRAGKVDATVVPIGLPVPATLHYVDVSADRKEWNNKCAAKYYGLRSIALGPATP